MTALVRDRLKHHRWLLLILALALFLRLYLLGLYPLSGDEYNSIAEAENLGLNWQSIIYSLLLHAWMQFGGSESWLRLLSALFGVITVGVLYAAGRELVDEKTGLFAVCLAALSPFFIYHAQELRFYAFFIMTASLFILATIIMAGRENTWRGWGLLALLATLVVFSHFLGILVVFTQLVIYCVVKRDGWSNWKRIGVATSIVAVVFAVPLIPGLIPALWGLYQRYANVTTSTTPVITQVSVVNAAKTLIAGYIFAFGYHLYPLSLPVVIPGLLLVVALTLLGARRLLKTGLWGVIPFVYAVLLVGVYFVLDPLGGRLAGGVAPRHVAFVSPVLILLLAVGLSAFPKRWAYVGLGGMSLLFLASLWPRWTWGWSYGGFVDYRAAAGFAADWLDPGDVIMHDGRSDRPIRRYFPQDAEAFGYWPYLKNKDLDDLAGYDQLLFVTNDFRSGPRLEFNQMLATLEMGFAWREGWVQYPLFLYVFDRKSNSAGGYPVLGSAGQVHQPLEIFGLEFQDLRLPVDLQVSDTSLRILGSFALPNLNGASERTVPIAGAPAVKRVLVVSNILDAGDLAVGDMVAEMRVESAQGEGWFYPLRLGEEVQTWDRVCAEDAACETVYRWHKKIALIGQHAYPGAWRDFQAGMHAVTFDFPRRAQIEKVVFRYLAKSGQLYIWGFAFPE